MKVFNRAFQNHHHEYNTHLISKVPRKFKENVFDRTTTDILKKIQTSFSNKRTLGDQEYRIRSLLTLDIHLFSKTLAYSSHVTESVADISIVIRYKVNMRKYYFRMFYIDVLVSYLIFVSV